MRHLVTIIIMGIVAAGLLTVSVSDQFADAGSRKKIHFTQTITSSQDPGRSGGQMALVFSPNEGTLYDGSITYAASEPVQLAVLHEIDRSDAGGQSVWTVDDKKFYAVSLFDAAKSGSLEFTGAALALRSDGGEFTTTVSVDAWTRGQPAEILVQRLASQKDEPASLLARANVPAIIPMHKGIYEGGKILYIITDSSNREYAQDLSWRQEWNVELAEVLADAPDDAVQKIFVFRNGIKGDGIYGFQDDLFSAKPGQDRYSALNSVIEVTWKTGQKEIVFESVADIIAAENGGRVKFKETEIIINTPQIVWPGGQMQVRPDMNITDDMPYDGGQVTEINSDEMTVTFVAHRGWGPDGQTIYYIATDATPPRTAETMGVAPSPASAGLVAHQAAVDLFQFKNGIRGPGPLGFQAGIAAAALGDENYSPMWRIHIVEWNDPESARLLETQADIDAFRAEDAVSVGIARPTNADHIVNCPFIDPFQ
ncbi:MAG: hypothetical protein D9C04_02665 [Nitrosopumilus sp. B06]|nr:MAG: hypothetical protein EB828_06010 [Nitrosopumilus sp. D6]RNJ80035.1 MAG: hypothetical protein D9C04_02665 [Nitrosopumilus sp. B06]